MKDACAYCGTECDALKGECAVICLSCDEKPPLSLFKEQMKEAREKALAAERETVAAIVQGLRAKATASVRLLEQCDVNDANKTVHAAQSLAFYYAAEWLERGLWKRRKERGDGEV